MVCFLHELLEDLFSKLREEQVNVVEGHTLVLLHEERDVGLDLLLHEVIVGATVRVDDFFEGLLLANRVQVGDCLDVQV